MKILVASTNKHKIEQIKLFFGKEYEIVSLQEYGLDLDIEETGNTFEENALLKAQTLYDLTGEISLGDDSGLCINHFDGWPGVMTHRFLGAQVSNCDRLKYILNRMEGLTESQRDAEAVSCLALCYGKDQHVIVYGKLKGRISEYPRGEHKFGYDEIFELENGKTAAEYAPGEKIWFNARSMSFRNLKEKMNEIFEHTPQ